MLLHRSRHSCYFPAVPRKYRALVDLSLDFSDSRHATAIYYLANHFQMAASFEEQVAGLRGDRSFSGQAANKDHVANPEARMLNFGKFRVSHTGLPSTASPSRGYFCHSLSSQSTTRVKDLSNHHHGTRGTPILTALVSSLFCLCLKPCTAPSHLVVNAQRPSFQEKYCIDNSEKEKQDRN